MNGSEPESPPPDAGSAEENWRVVSDSLLRGVSHALSNRLGALSAVSHVLGGSGDAASSGASLLELLRSEVSRAERVAALLHLLPRPRGRGAESLRVPDLLGEIIALHELQGPLRDIPCKIEVPGDMLPVRAGRPALTHALLLLLSHAARAAQLAGGGRIVLRCTGDEAMVSIAIETYAAEDGGGMGSSPRPEDLLEAVDPGAATALLRGEVEGGEGAEVVVGGGEAEGCITRVVLRLPTLSGVRGEGG